MTPAVHLERMHGRNITEERRLDPNGFVTLSKRQLTLDHEELHRDIDAGARDWTTASEVHVHGRTGEVRRAMKQSRTPIKAMSDGQMKWQAEFEAAKVIVHERSGGFCEMRFAEHCSGFVQHTHHRKGHDGPDANTPVNLLDVCLLCHRHGHANPEMSYSVGFFLKRNGKVSPLSRRGSDASLPPSAGRSSFESPEPGSGGVRERGVA